jgi:hypothetical protein
VITTIIVVGSVALALAFSAAWLLHPALRRRIEDPKHWFAAQVRQHDQACRDVRRIQESIDG